MYEEVYYQKSFLKEVVARIDFANPIEKLDKGVPSKLVGTIVKSFPIIEPTDVVMQEIAIEGNDLKSKHTAIKQWNYYSKERDRQLSLAPQNVFVQYKSYSSYDEAKGQFGAVVDSLNTAFPYTLASRFGLRYINQIDLALDDPTDWDAYIDAKLLCSRDFYRADESITRLITITELKYGDMGIRFQFGMPNPDYHAPVRRPLFVLDLDASISEAHELTETMRYMDEAHDRIQGIFERSITPALREKMDVRPVQQ
jgi:uncharacterized protein (TIGR04255 family)